MSEAAIQELAEWHRKIKAFEQQRNSQASEQERILVSQRQQIEVLKAENAKLQEDKLAQGSVGGVSTASSAQQERIDKLHELVDTYKRKVEVESRQLESLQQELDVIQAKVLDLRRLTGGSQAAAEAVKQAAKTKTLLQNRLEQAEKKFSEALTRNNELRRGIEEQNKSREAFESLCSQLERQLAAAASEVDSLRAAVTVANEARALAVTQLAAVRAQADTEERKFQEEIKELSQAQAADKALLQTQAKRLTDIVEAAEARDSLVTLEEPGGPSYEQAVVQLQQAFLTLMSTPGMNGSTTGGPPEPLDLTQLVAHFSGLEGHNFELFNACNAANEAIGSMQKELRALQVDIAQAETTGPASKQKDVIKATIAKRDQAIKRAEGLREQQVVLERRLALVRAGVSSTLRALGVTPAAAERPEDRVSLYATLMQNLGHLETRARAVVAVHATIMGKDNHAAARALVQPQLGLGHVAAASDSGEGQNQQLSQSQSRQLSRPASARMTGSSKALLGVAPTTLSSSKGRQGEGDNGEGESEDEDDDSDDGSVPLTREQLQARLGYKM